jgi:hypothetical protein
MKKLIPLSIYILIASVAACQTKAATMLPAESKDVSIQKFSWISRNKDTIYLLKTEIGYMVRNLWKDAKDEKKPVIIMTDALPARKGYEGGLK